MPLRDENRLAVRIQSLGCCEAAGWPYVQIVGDCVIRHAPGLGRDGVGAVGTFSLAGWVVLHITLIPDLSAGVCVPGLNCWEMRNDICIMDNSIGLWDLLRVERSELGISHSGLPEGIDSICALVELLDVNTCQNRKGSSQIVASHVDTGISINSMKTLNLP